MSSVDQEMKRKREEDAFSYSAKSLWTHSEQRATSSTQQTQRLSFKSREHNEKINTHKDLFRAHMIPRPAISTQLGEVLASRCFDMLPLAPGPTSSLLSVGAKGGQADWEHCCDWAQHWEIHGGWCVCFYTQV